MARNSTLTDAAREHLLRRVDMKRVATPFAIDLQPVSAPVHGPVVDFKSLPHYNELQLQRTIGDRLGLDPYFRTHAGRAGARTEINGRSIRNFSSYDYLGLNSHSDVLAAAHAAIDRYGVSAGASRHVGGARPVHLSLESAIAEHYGVDSAISFVSGYGTNVGVIGEIVGPHDLVIMDSVVHNSAVVGGALSGAERRSFPHNDFDILEEILRNYRHRYERALIVVEGLYSMHGDVPDLPRLIEIKRRHRAWLMVDEAHALGVLGRRGFGTAEHFGCDPRDVDIWMGTLSKTLAACGGYIAGSEEMVYYLKCTVGSFVYSVAMPPLIAATAEAALNALHRQPARVARLQHNAALFHRLAKDRGLETGTDTPTAVIPIVVGDSLTAVTLSQRLFEREINVQPVIYPAVPAKSSRLRFFVTAMHSDDDLLAAVDATAIELKSLSDNPAN